MVRLAIPLLAGALLLGAGSAVAQEVPPPTQPTAPPPDTGGDSFTIGLGGGFVPSYEGSDNYQLIPGGVVRGKVAGHNFFTRGLQFYFDLVPEADGKTLDLFDRAGGGAASQPHQQHKGRAGPGARQA